MKLGAWELIKTGFYLAIGFQLWIAFNGFISAIFSWIGHIFMSSLA